MFGQLLGSAKVVLYNCSIMRLQTYSTDKDERSVTFAVGSLDASTVSFLLYCSQTGFRYVVCPV